MEWLVLIMGIMIIVLLAQKYSRNKNIASALQQMQYIGTHDTNALVNLSIPDEKLVCLLNELNGMMEQMRKIQIQGENRELELRQQVSNISHDLRTPLTSILGYMEVIKRETTTEEEKIECLSVIENRAKVLQTLIAGFYELSRLEENKYVFELEPIHINLILCDLFAMFYQDLDQKFDVTLSIPEQLPLIYADKTAIIRIITNIIHNTLKHGTDFFHVVVKQQNEKIVMSFSNRTEDVKKSDLPYIFERFYTSDRIRSGQNTGLGLTIVKRLVENMNGTVEAFLVKDVFEIKITWNQIYREK